MRYRVSELEGLMLDAAVAKCEGATILPGYLHWPEPPATDPNASLAFTIGNIETGYHPSSEWHDGGPLIERERIELSVNRPPDLYNEWGDQPPWKYTWRADRSEGDTPLIAAMRAFVAAKFGDAVDIP